MVPQPPSAPIDQDAAPLHELMSRLLVTEPPPPTGINRILPIAGTLQPLNQRLVKVPVLDFINYTLRGIGQVIFVNNPLSGLLILLALCLQSPWVGLMGLIGVIAATLTALLLHLDRDTRRNGIYGYNGLLVGAALATFSDPSVGAGPWGWTIAVIIGASLTTILMDTLGVWWAKTFHSPPLTLPFDLVTLAGLALILWTPQPWFALGTAPPSFPVWDWGQLGAALPMGFGQVFLANQMLPGLLILVAVALCTPLGAGVGLLGSGIGLLLGLLLGIGLDPLYAGLWGYNALLSAMAIGGVFYAPNQNSLGVGAIAALLSALVGGVMGLLFTPLGLPVLTLPFCTVTMGCFIVLQRSLPSLVPVALHTIASPEEHRQRYQSARAVITTFRQQLAAALVQQHSCYRFDQASPAIKGDLRYLFNRIDTDQSGTLSTQELARHLHHTQPGSSNTELDYLFKCMDRDGSGTVEFAEFGELMLRHRHLMAHYPEFVTYFLPIDVNGDDAISLAEMNIAMASVGERPLSEPESAYLIQQVGNHPMTWHRFMEMLLVT